MLPSSRCFQLPIGLCENATVMDGFKNNLSPASTFLNQETNNYIPNPEKLYYCMYDFDAIITRSQT